MGVPFVSVDSMKYGEAHAHVPEHSVDTGLPAHMLPHDSPTLGPGGKRMH